VTLGGNEMESEVMEVKPLGQVVEKWKDWDEVLLMREVETRLRLVQSLLHLQCLQNLLRETKLLSYSWSYLGPNIGNSHR
jgi:hypothetical protein